MQMSILGFAIGLACFQRLADLPEPWVVWSLGGLGGGVWLAGWRWRKSGARLVGMGGALCLIGALALGLAWAGWRAHGRLAESLPAAWEGQDVEVVGFIAEMPQSVEHGVRFLFTRESAAGPVPPRLLLGWYDRFSADGAGDMPTLHAGERWRLTVRLKRPHGNANPGGFDYEAWLLERGIRATGYVRPGPANQRLDSFVATPGTLVERVRETLRARLEAVLAQSAYPGVIVALAVGDQRAIDPDLWRIFNRTGTQHLMAISGLHVGMVALLVGGMAMFLWRRVPALALRLATQRAGALAGWLAALGYGWVAGMGVPTQRTVLMLGVAAFAMLAGRQAAVAQVLGLALLAVLVVDPWAVLSAGFWLSFGAVAVLVLAAAGRLAREQGWRARWREFWHSQAAITVALIPILLALFNQFSLVSPLANGLAIPVVSLVVTPLVLAYLILPFPPLLTLADLILQGLMAALAWLAEWPLAVWQQAAPPWPVVLGAAVGCAWGLLPKGTPGRWLGWMGLIPLLAWSPPRPGPGAWRLTVLDVGQGLAVHVQTATHDLLYDTGPAWSREGNCGLRVVLPYLRAQGVRRLDELVVSHNDIDHAGGAASILAELPVASWTSSLGNDHPLRQMPVPHRPCQAGQGWAWDGVRFEILHPPPAWAGGPDNARSCVLRIAGSQDRALLLGDLEAPQEATLVSALGQNLASEVVVAPHHGSRSSSTPAFVAAVAPRVVIFPVGYLNRFHHPHPTVWTRWAETGAELARTDAGGAIQVDSQPGGREVRAFRQTHPRYWHGR